MKNSELMAYVCFLSISMITAVASTTLPLPLQLKKISKTSPFDQGKMHLELIISSETDVNNIEFIILALIKDHDGRANETTYENREIQNIPARENTTILYQVAKDAIGDIMTITISVHGNAEAPAAFLQQGLWLQEIAPALNWVGPDGKLGHKDTLRIATEIDITLNEKECIKAQTPCYFLHYNSGDSLEVCTKATTDKGELTDILQCDTTLNIGDSGILTSVRSIQLTYPEATSNGDLSMIVSAEYLDTSTKMEVVLYTGEYIMSFSPCVLAPGDTNDIKNCTLPIVTVNATEYIFSILMVTLGENDEVIKSTSIDFEDYKPQPISITSDIIYLTFSAKDKTTYKIYLDKEVPDGYRDVKVICGGDEVDKCTTYFLDLQSTTYVVSVKKNENGDLNIVEGTVTMISAEDPMICYPQDEEESSRNKSKEMMQLTHLQKEE